MATNQHRTVAKWLANMDIHEEEYVLLLQKKYGDFGPDFPAPVKFAAYEYEEGNEDTEEIYCIIDGNSDPEAAFVKAFMSDFAIKFLFNKAEQVRLVIAKEFEKESTDIHGSLTMRTRS